MRTRTLSAATAGTLAVLLAWALSAVGVCVGYYVSVARGCPPDYDGLGCLIPLYWGLVVGLGVGHLVGLLLGTWLLRMRWWWPLLGCAVGVGLSLALTYVASIAAPLVAAALAPLAVVCFCVPTPRCVAQEPTP